MPESTKKTHKYLDLANYFRQQVRSGALKPGDKLPTFAEMLAKHGVGQGTLERAYALLEDEQIIVREPKRGTFVAETQRGATGIIGVAMGAAPKDVPYYAHLMEGIHETAYRLRVEVLHLHEFSAVKWEKMDGVLTTHDKLRIPPSMPAISMVTPVEDMPCVKADDYAGGREATEHLIQLGHRRIAFLALGAEDVSIYRLKGYQDALQAAGIEYDKRWHRRLQDWAELFGPEKGFYTLGYSKMARWLKEDWAELGCTALLTQNDETAVGVLKALDEAGLSVPQDLSLVGFDGTEVANHVKPSLTTVEVPLKEIGAQAMEWLLEMIHGELPMFQEAEKSKILPTRLKTQESTASIGTI